MTNDNHELEAAAATVNRQILRGQAVAVAAARQAIAHEAQSFLPTWEQLTDKERVDAAVTAGWWLEAVRRAGLADRTVPARTTTTAGPPKNLLPPARRCGHCDQSIISVPRADGVHIQLDAEPSETGTFVILSGVAGVLLPKQAAAARATGQETRVHHRWTCPYSHRWAKS